MYDTDEMMIAALQRAVKIVSAAIPMPGMPSHDDDRVARLQAAALPQVLEETMASERDRSH